MQKNLSEGTMVLARPVYVRGKGSAVGQEEAKGPLGKYFDLYAEDAKWGEKTFEFAEKKFFLSACKRAIEDAGLSTGEVDLLLGDPTKARETLGWNPRKTSFDELVKIMTEHDMELVKNSTTAGVLK